MPRIRKSDPAERHERIRRQNATEIAEDYVEVIDDLIAANGEARVMELARHFGVSHVTVIRTLKRLQEQDLVEKHANRYIRLSDSGQQMATRSRERHELVIQFLRSIGVSSDQAAADAEGIEHHVSRETLSAMRKHLGKRSE